MIIDRKSPGTVSGRIVRSSTATPVGASGGVLTNNRTVATPDSYFPSLTLNVNWSFPNNPAVEVYVRDAPVPPLSTPRAGGVTTT